MKRIRINIPKKHLLTNKITKKITEYEKGSYCESYSYGRISFDGSSDD